MKENQADANMSTLFEQWEDQIRNADVNLGSQCVWCKHARQGKCAAFPDGVPDEILPTHHDHRKEYPGDHGVHSEAKKEPVNEKWFRPM